MDAFFFGMEITIETEWSRVGLPSSWVRCVDSELSFIRLFVLIGLADANFDPRDMWGFEAVIGRRILGDGIDARSFRDRAS